MSISFKDDLISGMRVSNTEVGWSTTRRIKVMGLDRTPANNIGYRAVQALAARTTDPIMYAAPHPTRKGLYATYFDTSPVANSKTQIVVDVTYEDLSVVTVEIDGTSYLAQTECEADGTPITALYQPLFKGKRFPQGFYPDRDARYVEASGPISIDILRPGKIVTFERWAINQGKLPGRYKGLVGCTNKEAWQNSPPETWLCTAIAPVTSLSIEPGTTRLAPRSVVWRERVSFEFKGLEHTIGGRPDSWRQIAYFEGIPGRTPKDVDPQADNYPVNRDGNGWREIVVQQPATFAEFALPTVFAQSK